MLFQSHFINKDIRQIFQLVVMKLYFFPRKGVGDYDMSCVILRYLMIFNAI